MLSGSNHKRKASKRVLIIVFIAVGLSGILIVLMYGCRWDSGRF
jgi:hypothetical protein